MNSGPQSIETMRKKSKDEEDIVPGFICKITPYDERFTTFTLMLVICPSEEDGDMNKCNTFCFSWIL